MTEPSMPSAAPPRGAVEVYRAEVLASAEHHLEVVCGYARAALAGGFAPEDVMMGVSDLVDAWLWSRGLDDPARFVTRHADARSDDPATATPSDQPRRRSLRPRRSWWRWSRGPR